MRFQSKKYLILSLAIHGLLIAILFFLPKKQKSAESKQVVQIEIRTEEIKPKISLAHGTHLRGEGSHKGGHQASAEKYLPSYHFGMSSINRGEDTYAENPLVDNPSAEWGSGSGTFARIADTNFFQVLYERVEYNLSYPGVLARHKIDGTVNARIVFQEDGACDWRHTSIHGHQPYLELYVLSLLKSVCQQNYKNYLGARLITNVDMSFKFDINENNDWERVKSQKLIVGNTLLFYRNSHQSVMEWELGPFKGMFPIPVIYLNIKWIQENWDHLMNDKDPLKEFKKEFGQS